MNKYTAFAPHYGSLWRTFAATAYAALCLVYFAWGWAGDLTEFGGDSATYMLMGRHFSPFYPDSAVLSETVRNAVYPPLFPLVIGWCGGSMLAGHLIVVASLLAAVLCLHTWLRQEQLGQTMSLWVAAVFALMPGTYFLTLNIWTENPYLLLSLVAILAESRAPEEGRRLAPLWTATAAVAGATLVRTAALPLLVAFMIRLLIVRPRHWPWLIAASAAPFVLWTVWSKLRHAGINGYVSIWYEVYGKQPFVTLLTQVETELGLVFTSWTQSWLGPDGASASLRYVVLATACICLVGWLRRLGSLSFDAIYVALYAVVLLIWPFPGEARRLSYVLVPVLLAQGAFFVHSMTRKESGGRGKFIFAVCLGVWTLVLLPRLFLTAHRFTLPIPAGLSIARHTEQWYGDDRLQAAQDAFNLAANLNNMRTIEEHVPQGDCVFGIKPSIVTLYSGRMSYSPPGAAMSDATFWQDIRKCRYAYALAMVSPTFREPFYPLRRLQGRGRVLSTANAGDELHPDAYGALVEIEAQP